MLRLRVTGILATLGLLMVGGGALKGSVAARPVLASPGDAAVGVLQLFYTPPVLVRAGERVLVPVDVVCATPAGTSCDATVSVAARAGAEAWHRVEAPGVKGMRFDLTAPASRASGAGRTGRVDFYLSARDASGRSTSLGSAVAPLSFYVVPDLPVVKVGAIAFGRVRRGRAVLSLPWGSGPMRAGIQPGIEAATLGPSSFDVDAAGRISVADSLQGRVAVFRDGALLRQTRLSLSARADIAVGAGGRTFVADREHRTVTVRTIGSTSRVESTSSIGSAAGWQIHATATGAFVNALPLDAWIGADSPLGPPLQGMPSSSDTRVIRLGTERSVRIGLVRGDQVESAVEITSPVRFGEVALADADGAGGLVVVVHVWRSAPTAADQYRVIHIRNGRVIETFAVANAKFAETPPLSRFRLAPNGDLYHLATRPSGMSIDRYAMQAGPA
jgi:hypothetical protein